MMKYEILDKAELDAGVKFYQAYFYGNGERSLLLRHLEAWPSHANWLVAEILFFLKNHDQDSRWPNGGIGYDICLLYTSPSPRDAHESRMPSSA